MITSYLVRCPYPECRWFGSLIPVGTAASALVQPGVRPPVTFRCPKCKGEWHGRIVGDDVKPLPLEAVQS
jgi:hypothetical protein